MTTQFSNVSDAATAQQTLQNTNKKLTAKHMTVDAYFRSYDYEKTGKLTLRNFKYAIHSLAVGNFTEIDNLAKFLDKANDGFIKIQDIESAVQVSLIQLMA